jgi:hypothetical protein
MEEKRAMEKPQVRFNVSGSEAFTRFKTISRRYRVLLKESVTNLLIVPEEMGVGVLEDTSA